MARTKKKGRALKVTRPEPTIYGNCDSWSFIVGKKPRAYRRSERPKGSLRTSNRNFIHNLSTISTVGCKDNMWAICGRHAKPSRISSYGRSAGLQYAHKRR